VSPLKYYKNINTRCAKLQFCATGVLFSKKYLTFVVFNSKSNYYTQIMQENPMQKAIALSLENIKKGLGGPFGAVIVDKNGKMIGEGANCVTSTNDPTAHAEMVAIRNACTNMANFSLEGATIYTSCEPCPMCLAAIYWARIDKIVYANSREDAAAIGFDDQLIYDEIPKPLNERLIPIERANATDAVVVFEAWTAKMDKIAY
jgi:guanine deaminase